MKDLLLKKKLERKLEKIDREILVEKARNSERLRKERTHKLIKLGALFEISDLMEVSETTLLGYLLCLKNKENLEKLDYWDNLGSKTMADRIHLKALKKKKQVENKTFTHSDILELLKKSQEKNINIIAIAQKNFKKNLLENLTYKEFEFLKNILENC